MLNSVFIRSNREFKMAVWVANSVVGRGAEGKGGELGVESSHDGVEGRAGVTDCAGVETLPKCVDDLECVPGNGRVGRTDTGSRITFLKEARKFVLSFSRITCPRDADSKSLASF